MVIFATEENFDEEAYLLHNGDVAAAVKMGRFSSGREHFEKHRHETRIIGYDASYYDCKFGLTSKLPPPGLVALVNGHTDLVAFANSRRPAADIIVEFLTAVEEPLHRFKSILDFGCGCGRIVAGFEGLLPQGTKISGCDVNPKLLNFSRDAVSFAEFVVNDQTPPLPFPDGQFDLVYCSSVFTHMSQSGLEAWASELRRIVMPNGVVLVTHHGTKYAGVLEQLSSFGSRILAEQGFYVHWHEQRADEDGSNDIATFASSDFMLRLFKGFDLIRIFPGVTYGPNAFCADQDTIIFRRR
ncbi:class I SAM-dependent methyltransferase [Agrobacterium vitis]|uniref:Class I SAM-dependent methyltransferase n=1 Tax=Agrobacterium vitis TaxID=373 RepID=A0A368NHV6_AGRVI|nr:class I SAM-dependent methyltransferase [Agrobacterium vitis]KAA3525960.1 class I SAM-dependent methyltransferase [Agrobacterium vitis]RCU48999.1 class I SAM-dependent methyltransferase [Agrobacterium vitis]